jgi:serine phosphatase RsbU (regulator of sigma subunit)
MRIYVQTSILFISFLVLFNGVFGQSLSNAEKKAGYYFDMYQKYEYADTLRAKKYADSGLYWAQKSENPLYLGRAHQFLGWYDEGRSRYEESREHYYKSLSYMRKAKDNQGIADAYGNLGNAYYSLNELTKCLEMQLLSLEYNELILKQEKDEEKRAAASAGRAIALHNTGDLYLEIGLYRQASDYLRESLKYDREFGTPLDRAISFGTLGMLYKDWGKPDSAALYFEKALAIDDLRSQADEYSLILLDYATLDVVSLSQYERSEMAKDALFLTRRIGKTRDEAKALIQISDYFFDQLSTDSLSSMLRKAYSIIRAGNLTELNPEYFRMYSRYNSRLGDFEQAYFALDNYLEMKMVADEQRRTQDVIAGGIRYKLQSRFEQDSLRQANQFANERNQYLEDISEIQDIVYLSVIGFIILISSLVYYVTSNRRKNKLNEVLVERNQLVQEQKDLVEERNKSISASINYARRLQTALLPTPEQINAYLPDSFLFFRPKDVVSGDFYWFEQRGDWSFLAVADCTGHGVPGAMVSVVCSNALNRSVKEFELSRPKDILDKTRELVLDAFVKSKEQVADGMDISLIAIHSSKKKIVFAGAHNSLWLIRENSNVRSIPDDIRTQEGEHHTLIEWKGEKQPIGRFQHMQPFEEYEIALEPNDQIYLMSDGFADQFGGPNGKKYKYIALKKLFLQHAEKSMTDQGKEVTEAFDAWIGGNEQIDDVCVLGVRFS